MRRIDNLQPACFMLAGMLEIISPAEACARFGEITAPVGGQRVHTDLKTTPAIGVPTSMAR